MKIAVVTAMWKRPQIFKLFAKHISKLNHATVEIRVFVVGSEGNTSRVVAESYGFNYFEMPNDYVSDKFNYGVAQAKKWKPDYVMIAGSDDIMCNDLFSIYVGLMQRKVDFIGLIDFYIFDSSTRRAMYWGGYTTRRLGEPAGAFRCLSKRLLRKMKWQPFDSGLKRGIDRTLWKKVNSISHTQCIFSIAKHNVFAVDIKSDTNINWFHLWENCQNCRPKEIIDKFEL
jgi:hypothetical protein